MQDFDKIRARVRKTKIRDQDLAKKLGMTWAKLQNRLYGRCPWKTDELIKLDEILEEINA